MLGKCFACELHPRPPGPIVFILFYEIGKQAQREQVTEPESGSSPVPPRPPRETFLLGPGNEAWERLLHARGARDRGLRSDSPGS
jgi:hypothetical protein